jgi:M6 family metalloprotease-like protein
VGQPTYYWPGSLGSTKPPWADYIIQPSASPIGTSNLTHYFHEASLGRFFFIGDVYKELYVFEHPSNYYTLDSGRHVGYAVKECLENLDSEIDYSQYDKFDPLDYDNDNNVREPDGQVDFILVVFRFFLGTLPGTNSGVAALGGTDYNFGGTTTITLDGKTISSDFPGSGALTQMLTPFMYNTAAHELGHYLLNHHRNYMGMWNLMNTNGNSFVCAEEREFLGWHGTAYTPTSNSTITLGDYGTTGDYIKFTKGGKTYYIESRRRINYHLKDWKDWPYYSETPRRNLSRDSGLFIYTKNYDYQVAQGRFDWLKSLTYPTRYIVDSNYFSKQIVQFFPVNSNRLSGENPRDLVNESAVNINTGSPFLYPKTHWGDAGDSNTCFDVGYNQVFSPWSNPYTPTPTSSDSFAVEITGKDGNGNMIVKIYFTNLPQSAPSKPQNLKITKEYTSQNESAPYHPKLDWYANLEPDIASYKVYRGNVSTAGIDASSYTYVGTTSSNSFVDESTTLYDLQLGGGICEYQYRKFSYRITAVDSETKESVKSERDTVDGYIDPCGIEDAPTSNNTNEIVVKNSLSQNYPNPFNPSSKINYSVLNSGYVDIRVYDILGREIKVLVSEYKQQGNYALIFDAGNLNLASGIYYYKMNLRNGNSVLFSDIKRMVLVK